ncbi:hypothetical protein [Ferrimicrobium sp.]|uniref:hypothetical protein n=1 Tax=Ferrimicrobium sp. TaxID=2926050 RepID=UPI002635C129|nr:hypothetical protein [Ferrimicrobium sp.]
MRKLLMIGASALVLAACGSTAAKSSATTTTTKKTTTPSAAPVAMTEAQAAKVYTAAIGPMNSALTALGKQANGWTNSTPTSTVTAALAPVNSALTKGENELNALAVKYPKAATALHNLTTAASSMDGVLNSVTSANVFSLSSWVTQLEQAASVTNNDANIVRSELGLPPTSQD